MNDNSEPDYFVILWAVAVGLGCAWLWFGDKDDKRQRGAR